MKESSEQEVPSNNCPTKVRMDVGIEVKMEVRTAMRTKERREERAHK